MGEQPTPRQVRHHLNKMEGWYRRNRHRFVLQYQEAADALFEQAVSAFDAAALAEALKAWLAESERRAELVGEMAREVAREPAEAVAADGHETAPTPEPR